MHAMFSWANWLRLFGRNKPAASPRNGRRVTPRKRAQDFADYGTAFGLDLSLSGDTTAAKPAVEATLAETAVKRPSLPGVSKAAPSVR